MQLDEHQLQEAKGVLNSLRGIYKEQARLEAMLKSREEQAKFSVAQELNISNKKGEPQPSKVNISLLYELLEAKFNEKDSGKFQKVVSDYTIYSDMLESDDNSSELKPLIELKGQISEKKEDIKYTLKEITLLDGETIKAIEVIAKEEYKLFKEKALEEEGFETKPKKEPDLELQALIEELRKKL